MMSEKRKRDHDDAAAEQSRARKKQKQGFKVGPQNLPDGAHRRKTQQIKRSLIERAQIKKNYEKLKRQDKLSNHPQAQPRDISTQEDDGHEPTTAPHPDRQTMIDNAGNDLEPEEGPGRDETYPKRRKPKTLPFKREHEEAQKRKAEAEERRKAREEAEKQRKAKIEERERFRKAMAKARTGGPNGQRKLGRESKVLLERVKKLVGDGR